jgi:glycosyltransferase involved in cell wall biosynthesis
VISGEYSTPEFRARFREQARNAALKSDLIIAVSEFTARQVEELLGFPRARIRVVHHGAPVRKLPSIPRENVLLCLGALQKRKNQAALVRAFRVLPKDWRLVLAGSPGYGAEEVSRSIAESACRERIVVTGYIPDDEVAAWYAKASLFAFPSLDEGFGMPALEAMAAGIPVIAGNRGALPEVVGDAAMLIDPHREDELETALQACAFDTDLREELIAKGYERSALFTWPKAVERTLTVYRELLG